MASMEQMELMGMVLVHNMCRESDRIDAGFLASEFYLYEFCC